tara:strand:- start:1843 stop:2154 length:312 start_codon:yes stop_codon:yes gene_type:complete
MNYKDFKRMIDLMVFNHKNVGKACDIKLDIIEFTDDYNRVINLLLSVIMTEDGLDWFYWFLYEKDGIEGKIKKDMKAYDENKKEICKNVKELHEYLTKNKYFK